VGIVRMGPPQELVLLLQRASGASHFVETGTYRGSTALWAAAHFERVITIEAAEALYQDLAPLRLHSPNVSCILGESQRILPSLVPTLPVPSIFWLDAHWSGGQTHGAQQQCPLLEELAAIGQKESDHLILIDDARLFLSAPPRPHDPSLWPTIGQVVPALGGSSPHRYVAVCEDVIISVPGGVMNVVVNYCQDVNTAAWQSQVPKSGRRYVQEGVHLLMREAVTNTRRFAQRVSLHPTQLPPRPRESDR
jgi:hypothetical protein